MIFSKDPLASRRKNHDLGIASPGHGGQLSVEDFLGCFKTSCCLKPDPHDARMCFHFHSEEDRRRNPYDQFYTPKDARNEAERDYHPVLYKVEMCLSQFSCLGKFCARAHRPAELRSADYTRYCNDHACPMSASRPSTASDTGSLATMSSLGSIGSEQRSVATRASSAASRLRAQCRESDRHFKSRLEEKAREVQAAYGTAPVLRKLRGSAAAAEARRRILRLCCSLCESAYTAADGCMAICCTRCTQWFCGWCLQTSFADSTRCHQHVAQCPMNTAAAKAVFATDDEIEYGQHRLRVAGLAQHLSKYSDRVKKLIFEELAADLKQYRIDPAEVGVGRRGVS